jgi:hypothetical protein
MDAHLERYDGVLDFAKTNINFQEREFDKKSANWPAALPIRLGCRIIWINTNKKEEQNGR